MNTKKILITGGCGFMGGSLAKKLSAAGYSVTALDTAPLPEDLAAASVALIPGDITDRKLTGDIIPQYDVVFNFAGLIGTHKLIDEHKAYEAARVNILGTVNILDAAKEKQVRIYQVTKPNYWLNTYTITKIAAEKFSRMYFEEFGLPVTLLRYYNIYGPNQKTDVYQKAVPTFVAKALRNEPIPIFGSGKQTTDHLFVDDAIEATVSIMAADKFVGESVDIGSGEQTSVLDIAKTVIRLSGSSSEIAHQKMRSGEDAHTEICADTAKLKSTGFEAKFTFEQGIKKTIDFYKNKPQ